MKANEGRAEKVRSKMTSGGKSESDSKQFENISLYKKLKSRTTQNSNMSTMQTNKTTLINTQSDSSSQNFTSPAYLNMTLQKESMKLN